MRGEMARMNDEDSAPFDESLSAILRREGEQRAWESIVWRNRVEQALADAEEFTRAMVARSPLVDWFPGTQWRIAHLIAGDDRAGGGGFGSGPRGGSGVIPPPPTSPNPMASRCRRPATRIRSRWCLSGGTSASVAIRPNER
jgi:hypothetical protein